MTTPRPGWYQDPLNPAQQKWWDGTAWTDYTLPMAGAGAGAPSPAPAAGAAAAGPAAADATAVPSEAATTSEPVEAEPAEAAAGPGEAASDGKKPAEGFAGFGQPYAGAEPYAGSQGYPGAAAQGYPGAQGAPGFQQGASAGQGYPGAPQQGYADPQGSPDHPGYTDQPGYPGQAGYQQGYAGSHPAYTGYPGYPGYAAPQRSNPAALTGFILGIVAFFLFFIPFLGTAISLGAGAFSAVGLSHQQDRAPVFKVFGIIGLVLGIIYTLLSVGILWLVLDISSSTGY